MALEKGRVRLSALTITEIGIGSIEESPGVEQTCSINRDISETWIIFTDGAFEPTNTQPASIGESW